MEHASLDIGCVPQTQEIPQISARSPDSELLKVFLHSAEKERLKEASDRAKIPMSHLVRLLLLKWLADQE